MPAIIFTRPRVARARADDVYPTEPREGVYPEERSEDFYPAEHSEDVYPDERSEDVVAAVARQAGQKYLGQ
jgi:hypothetical protein